MKKIIATLVVTAAFGVLGCTSDSTSDEPTAETDDNLALGGGGTTTVRVNCSSQLFQRRECNVDTQGGRIVDARITNDVSTPPFACRQGDSNGFTPNSVWVDRGCSAEFEVRINAPAPQPTRERLRCASDGGNYRVCDSRLRDIQRIRLLREESGNRCEQGRSFGFYSDAIWVDRGCRGEFEVTGRQGGPSNSVELYDRSGGQGNRVVVSGVISNLSDLGFNDRTQSIVIRNGTWELCQHENFNGWCRTFGPGQYDDLGPLQGEITSVRPR